MSLGIAPLAELAIADQARDLVRMSSGNRRIIPRPDQVLTPESR